MKRLEQLYEGKAKILYSTDNPDLLIQYFKDDATAFNAEKKGTIKDKGIINNKGVFEDIQISRRQGRKDPLRREDVGQGDAREKGRDNTGRGLDKKRRCRLARQEARSRGRNAS